MFPARRKYLKQMKEEIERYRKNNPVIMVEMMPGESIPFAHPYGDYVETTSHQRLHFRADGLAGTNPKYYIADSSKVGWQELQKTYDSNNKWRFIIENVFKISEENFDEFRARYVNYRCVILECQKYTSLLVKAREDFYKESGRTLSPNLQKLEEKKLFYF